MIAEFTIDVEPDAKLLKLTLAGFFDQDDVQRFAVEKAQAHARLGVPPHSHVTLVDVRECRIQTQEVATIFARVLRDSRYRAHRLAFVTAGSLAKMQVRRLIEGLPHARQFDDEAAARCWLTDELRQAA